MTETQSLGNFLEFQWLELCVFTARGMGSMPGWGTKISHATKHGSKKKKQKTKNKDALTESSKESYEIGTLYSPFYR